ncbi:LPD7 domain-containing protein, partial [Burkholderia sp. HI2500]|uniref:LPD7 domain-containing protein n=1 Tax=Burkholderia sp. HI2500 TaxID=2015358 RepID=UPI000B920686
DERALAELRRTGNPSRADEKPVNTIRPGMPGVHEDNAILFHGPELSLSVDEGGSVSYRRDGKALIVDRGDAVDVLQVDRAAIETGLRLAQMKFGRTLELDGSDEFQQAAIEVAAAAGLSVQFSNENLNRALAEARSSRVARQLADVSVSLGMRDDATRPAPAANTAPEVGPDGPPKPRGPRV